LGDVEKLHPWLFTFGIGLLFGIIAWYFAPQSVVQFEDSRHNARS
jgi:hypothetical protein